jgi:uncharacterized protein YegL
MNEKQIEDFLETLESINSCLTQISESLQKIEKNGIQTSTELGIVSFGAAYDAASALVGIEECLTKLVKDK